jgi:hypothetical protein
VNTNPRAKRSWLRVLICVMSTSVLTACVSGAQLTAACARVQPDAALLEPMPRSLPEPASSRLPDLLANHTESAEQYFECVDRHDGLIDANKEPPPPKWWEFWKVYW